MMFYKMLIYTVCIIISAFAVNGINFNGIIKKNYRREATVLWILISIALGFLVGSFIIDFLDLSRFF